MSPRRIELVARPGTPVVAPFPAVRHEIADAPIVVVRYPATAPARDLDHLADRLHASLGVTVVALPEDWSLAVFELPTARVCPSCGMALTCDGVCEVCTPVAPSRTP